eukprot:scaffold847_cov199-Alexandrium_tamarense.AAC.8
MDAVRPFPTDGFASCVQAIERTAQLAHSQTDLSLLVFDGQEEVGSEQAGMITPLATPHRRKAW